MKDYTYRRNYSVRAIPYQNSYEIRPIRCYYCTKKFPLYLIDDLNEKCRNLRICMPYPPWNDEKMCCNHYFCNEKTSHEYTDKVPIQKEGETWFIYTKKIT